MAKLLGTVAFYGMRHGDKDGDALTPLGEQQVVDSARANLAGIKFDLALWSGMNRAKQTVQLVLKAIGLVAMCEPPALGGEVPTLPELRFGLDWADPGFKWLKKPEATALNAADRMLTPIATWLNVWPPARAIALEVKATLQRKAWELVNQSPGQRLNVFIASHSPVVEMAVGRPDRLMGLRPADIVVYTVRVYDDGTCRLRTTGIMRAPY